MQKFIAIGLFLFYANDISKMKILFTFAIEEEVIDINLSGHETLGIITGIGKSNAALQLTKAIITQKPDYVINIGTAGTLSHHIGDIFVCQNFCDRDLESTRIPGIDFIINVHSPLPPIACFKKATKRGMVNTGDQFITETSHLTGDVIDMEAYAEALVCKEFNVPFIAIKYISDIVGKNSISDWQAALADARKALSSFFHN